MMIIVATYTGMILLLDKGVLETLLYEKNVIWKKTRQ